MNKKRLVRNWLNVDRNASTTEGNAMLDKGFGVSRQHSQIRDSCIGADVRSEMPPQPGRPDIANSFHVFVFAGFAAGPFPAIADGTVKHLAEKRNLVIEQALDRMQRGHELETRAESEHAGVHVHQPAKWAVLTPWHRREVMIPDQIVRIGADRAHR